MMVLGPWIPGSDPFWLYRYLPGHHGIHYAVAIGPSCGEFTVHMSNELPGCFSSNWRHYPDREAAQRSFSNHCHVHDITLIDNQTEWERILLLL